MAHEDVVDLVGADAGALERGLDGEAAEIGGLEAGERPGQLADRGAGTSEDHGTSHLTSPCGRGVDVRFKRTG